MIIITQPSKSLAKIHRGTSQRHRNDKHEYYSKNNNQDCILLNCWSKCLWSISAFKSISKSEFAISVSISTFWSLVSSSLVVPELSCLISSVFCSAKLVLFLVLSKSKFAGQIKDKTIDITPPMTKAVTLPANDTHWFDKLSTVILPVYVLQVINQTINARTIPPTEPPTAPAWFKSFHVKAKAIERHLML